MGAFPISGRARLRAAIEAKAGVGKAGELLDQHAAIINDHTNAPLSVGALLTRNLWGRLKWLAVGK